MSDQFTTNLSFTKPEVGGSVDTWGDKTNANWDILDAIFASAGSGASVGLYVGTGKTIKVDGTLNTTSGATVVLKGALLSTYIATLLDDADAATARTTLGVTIGTNVQAYDATLASLSALGTAADKIAYTTGVDTWAETGLSAFMRTVLDDADAATAAATLSVLSLGGGALTGTLTINNAGGTNAVFSETGIDRNSGSAETFNIQNSGAGAMTLQVDGVAVRLATSPVPIGIACSDETTALAAGTGKVTFRMPFAMTLTEPPRVTLTTAQTSGNILTVDINEAGTSILSTKITVDNTEKTSKTAATAAVLSDTTLADDAEMTVDFDQIGDGTAKGLKIWLIGYPT